MDARQYAECLVAIVERFGQEEMRNRLIHKSAITMSTVREVEDRLLYVLRAGGMVLKRRFLVTQMLIAVFVLLIGLTTVRVVPASAQEPNKSTLTIAVVTDATSEVSLLDTKPAASTEIAGSENNLVDRIQNCDVLNVTGEGYQLLSAEFQTDPVYACLGKIVDPDGTPVPNVDVRFTSSFKSIKTDKEGNFRLRYHRGRLPFGNVRLAITPPRATALLYMQYPIANASLVSQTPVSIQLKQGVIVRGKVTVQDGSPLPKLTARVASDTNRTGTACSPDGSFQLVLAKETNLIVVGTDQPGYAVPNLVELSKITNVERAVDFPHAKIDLFDGAVKPIRPITIEIKRQEPRR